MRHATRKDRRRGDDGIAMIEFAIVVSLFIMLVFGVFEFGLGYSAKVEVTSAARDGARAAALRQSLPTPPPGVTYSVNASCTPGDTTSNARVTATRSVSFLIPFWSSGTWTITSTGTMRCGG